MYSSFKTFVYVEHNEKKCEKKISKIENKYESFIYFKSIRLTGNEIEPKTGFSQNSQNAFGHILNSFTAF